MALTDDLISWWSLDEASGDAIDAHATNDLTETSGTIASTTGKVDNGRDFEASDTEYFARSDNADLSTGNIDFTLACWINLESTSRLHSLIWKGDAANGEYQLYIYSDNIIYFDVYGSALFGDYNFVGATTHGVVSTSTWYFVVAWHDATANTINIQLNNGTADNQSHSAGVYDGIAAFHLGGEPTNNYLLDGVLDEVGFWKRVLTADERTALYNSGNGLGYDDLGGSTAYTLDCETTAYAITPTNADLTITRELTAETTAYAITPTNADLSRTTSLNLESATYTITPTDAELDIIPRRPKGFHINYNRPRRAR
jgi:hypothetical protein